MVFEAFKPSAPFPPFPAVPSAPEIEIVPPETEPPFPPFPPEDPSSPFGLLICVERSPSVPLLPLPPLPATKIELSAKVTFPVFDCKVTRTLLPFPLSNPSPFCHTLFPDSQSAPINDIFDSMEVAFDDEAFKTVIEPALVPEFKNLSAEICLIVP